MTNDKNKLDFNKLKSRKKIQPSSTTRKVVYKEVEQVPKEETPTPPKKQPKPKIEEKKKVGRKSWKKDGITYTRLAFDTPITTKQKLKELLAVKFFGVYISQDEMINVALDNFIKKHSS